MTASAQFLNVDIDLHSQAGLQELLDALGTKILVLHAKEEFVSFALSEICESPAAIAIALSELIGSLPEAARQMWDRCPRKEFNIGIAFVEGASATEFELSRETLERIASLGLSLRFTTYPAQ